MLTHKSFSVQLCCIESLYVFSFHWLDFPVFCTDYPSYLPILAPRHNGRTLRIHLCNDETQIEKDRKKHDQKPHCSFAEKHARGGDNEPFEQIQQRVWNGCVGWTQQGADFAAGRLSFAFLLKTVWFIDILEERTVAAKEQSSYWFAVKSTLIFRCFFFCLTSSRTLSPFLTLWKVLSYPTEWFCVICK